MNKMISGLQCSTRADREKKSPVLTAFFKKHSLLGNDNCH